MTFYEISKKMLTASFHRYKLYFFCNMFSVSLFYSFAAIFTNKYFMDGTIVDKMISSNIYAPSIFVGIFLALFIPCSYNAFQKNRKHEYGILMALGMSETEVLKNMLFENCMIAALSLISGLLLGTAISFIFYFIIEQVIGISSLRWYFNVDSYKWTILLYFITILITLLTGILGFLKLQISELMKVKYMAETKGKALSGVFIAGMVLLIVSILIMLLGYGQNSENMWLASLIVMFTGLYMIITHVESVEQFLAKIFPCYIERHSMELSFVKQHHRSRNRISIIAACLIGFSIFFSGFSAVLYPSHIRTSTSYSPYDLVYSRIFEKNQVEDIDIEKLLNKNGVSVKTFKQVDYLRNNAFNLLPVSEVNRIFDCSYKISEGKFLTVFQYDMKDGYEHKIDSPEKVSFNCGSGEMQLQSIGSDIRILFNVNPTFADKTLVLNDTDFNKIASESRDYWKGIMKLYIFDDWKNSGKGVAAVQKFLLEKNQVGQEEQHYFRASSRIETYKTAKQSSEFLAFLMFFIVVLFCGASNILIHFKIKAEEEEEQRMLSGLYRIGVTEEEMLGMISHKNLYYFMPQVITGVFIGVFYNYTVNKFYGYGWSAAGYSLLIGLTLTVLQYTNVRTYSKRELLNFII